MPKRTTACEPDTRNDGMLQGIFLSIPSRCRAGSWSCAHRVYATTQPSTHPHTHTHMKVFRVSNQHPGQHRECGRRRCTFTRVCELAGRVALQPASGLQQCAVGALRTT
eukprot:363534-Chlamydomonas_euryale.AAC.3